MNIIEEMRAFAPCFMATPDEVCATITRWADWLEQNKPLVYKPMGRPVKATRAGEALVTIPDMVGVYRLVGTSYHNGGVFAIMRNAGGGGELEVSEAVKVTPVYLESLT